MQSKYRNILKERLIFYKMWKNDWDLYFFHKSISEKAKKKYYSERKFLNLILSIYFLPLKVFKFILPLVSITSKYSDFLLSSLFSRYEGKL